MCERERKGLRVPFTNYLLHRSDPCAVRLTDEDVRTVGPCIHVKNHETDVHQVCVKATLPMEPRQGVPADQEWLRDE